VISTVFCANSSSVISTDYDTVKIAFGLSNNATIVEAVIATVNTIIITSVKQANIVIVHSTDYDTVNTIIIISVKYSNIVIVISTVFCANSSSVISTDYDTVKIAFGLSNHATNVEAVIATVNTIITTSVKPANIVIRHLYRL
jgi:hypothetical protein